MDSTALMECFPESSGELAYEVLTEEDDLLEKLKKIEPVVKDVLQSNSDLFASVNNKRGHVTIKPTLLGRRLLAALENSAAEVYCYFPLCALNPYIELLFKHAGECDSILLLSATVKLSSAEVKKEVSLLNGLVKALRAAGASKEFKLLVGKFVKAERKRAKSLGRYIDALFQKHSRMVVLRADLYYQSGLFNERANLKHDLRRVNSDWETFRKDLHKGLPIKGMLGFACKLEYGLRKGFHFHLLVFYSGADYREDVVLARLIGEHWVQKITGGRGWFFNCNKKKSNNGYIRPGIGVIDWSNEWLLSNLKNEVAPYLIKTDYWLRLSPDCNRSFFRGNMPKLDSVKRGRPRRVN